MYTPGLGEQRNKQRQIKSEQTVNCPMEHTTEIQGLTGLIQKPFADTRRTLLKSAPANARRGMPWPAQLVGLVALGGVIYLLAGFVGNVEIWAEHRFKVLLALGGIGCWRWGWFVLQNIRAAVYRYWVFPRLRREAGRAVAAFGPVPEVTIMATTYREKPWITAAVFRSVYSELSTVKGMKRRARIIVATGCDEDDASIWAVHRDCCGQDRWPASAGPVPELILLRADNGKRGAISAALIKIAQQDLDPSGVVVFMDGDTIVQPGLLREVLPLFRLDPPVAAVTTNEDGYVDGPGWFAEWISLRFGLRHRTMCSIALSGKLLCLTGRLSAFRASIAIDPSFREQIERDAIEHWLWGSFEMLSGDDKSTWYWLARHGKRMLYVPSAMATTIEVVPGGGVQRALANIRRWSGNSMRHSWRAIKLGPRTLGWFCWYSLLDQRIAMFTVLVGPVAAVWALCLGQFELAAAYGLWLLLSRLAHSAIAWRHGRRWSAWYVPMEVLSEWLTAITKIWVLFHPAKQSWFNRGARTFDTTRKSAHYAWQKGVAHYMYGFTCGTAIIAVGLLLGFLPILRDLPLFLPSRSGWAQIENRSLGIAQYEETSDELSAVRDNPATINMTRAHSDIQPGLLLVAGFQDDYIGKQ